MSIPDGLKKWLQRLGNETEARIFRSWKTTIFGLLLFAVSTVLLHSGTLPAHWWAGATLVALWAVGHKETKQP